MKKTSAILALLLALGSFSLASGQYDFALRQFRDDMKAMGYHILAVSSLSVRPIFSDQYQNYTWGFNEIGLTCPAGNPGSIDFVGPISLPDGAVIKKVIALYYDNNAAADIEIMMGRLYATDLTEPASMVEFTSEGKGNQDNLRKFSSSNILNPTIDNSYVYVLSVSLDSSTDLDVVFRGFWIAYE